MHITNLDIIFIIILALFFARGLFKGLVKYAFGFVTWAFSFVASVAITPFANKFILQTNLASSLNGKVSNWLINKNNLFAQPILSSDPNFKNSVKENLSVPNFLANKISAWLTNGNFEGQQVSEVVSPEITKWILGFAVFLILFLLILILLKAIGRAINVTISNSILGGLNHFVGGIFGLTKALIIIFVLLTAFALAMKVPLLNKPIAKLLTPHLESSQFCITKFLYDINPIRLLFGKS